MTEVINTFAGGPEGWCSYEYHASVVAGQNYFVLTTWEERGGVDDGGFVWADQTRWSTDAPEKPVSILPLILYRNWVGEPPIDLRGAELSVQLRGDGLDVGGAECYFWAHTAGTRWHCNGQPVPIADGQWGEPARVPLQSDESMWYRSWTRFPEKAASLDTVLGGTTSYGFSFVGLSREVTGKLSLGSFAIRST